MICKHKKLVLYKRYDANMEPVMNANGEYTTIVEDYKCIACGKIMFTKIAPV